MYQIKELSLAIDVYPLHKRNSFTIFFKGIIRSAPGLNESKSSVTAMNLTLRKGNTLSM